MYVKESISVKQLDEFCQNTSMFQILWLKINFSFSSKLVCSIYRSPNSNKVSDTDFFNSLDNTLEVLCTRYPNSEVCLLGDFNIHNEKWLSHSKGVDYSGQEMEKFCIIHNLDQLVDQPTRFARHIRDSLEYS